MYDFNIIVKNEHQKEKHSFTIDIDGEIYKFDGSRNYLLEKEEIELIKKVGGIEKIFSFLISTNYRCKYEVDNLEVINLNP